MEYVFDSKDQNQKNGNYNSTDYNNIDSAIKCSNDGNKK